MTSRSSIDTRSLCASALLREIMIIAATVAGGYFVSAGCFAAESQAVQHGSADPAKAIGPDQCAKCHQREVQQWMKTPHFATFDSLLDDTVRRLREHHALCRTVTVKVRYTGFVTKSRAQSLDHPTHDGAILRVTARALLEELLTGQPVRLVGVALSSLEPDGGGQPGSMIFCRAQSPGP